VYPSEPDIRNICHHICHRILPEKQSFVDSGRLGSEADDMPLIERLQWGARRKVNGSQSNRELDQPDLMNIEASDEIHNDVDNEWSLLGLRNNLE